MFRYPNVKDSDINRSKTHCVCEKQGISRYQVAAETICLQNKDARSSRARYSDINTYKKNYESRQKASTINGKDE